MGESRVKSDRGRRAPQPKDAGPRVSLFYVTGVLLTLTALVYRLSFSSLGGGFIENGISYILFFAGFAAILASAAGAGEPPLRMSLATGALALYVLAAVIASKSSGDFRAAFEPAVLLVALWCLFAAVNGRMLGHDDAPRAAAILVSLVAIAAAAGFYQYFYEFDAMLEEIKTIRLPGYVAGVYIDAKSVEDFRTRVAAREVFGTLFTSNVFSGFLALVLPVTLGLMAAILRGSASRRAKTAGAIACAALAAAQAALVYWTKSKGGLAALAAGMAVLLLIALYRTVSRRKFVGIVAALAIAAAAGAYAALPRAKQFYYEARTSMQVRAGYWSATWRMIKSEPLLGVGLGNFTEHYLAHKGIGEREVQNPHNAYLLVWAETGLFTLLFFAAFWVLVFAGPRGTGGSARPPSRGLVIAAIVAAAALYLAMQPPGAFAGAFPSAAAYAAGALAAAAATAVLWPAISGADVGLVRAGLAGGLVGFLVSSAVDVTFSDAPAAAAAVFAAAAYAPRGKTAALASGGFNARIAAGAALVALMAFVGAGFLPLGQAHSAMEDARHYALQGDLARAAERARLAMTLDPTNVRPVYQLAYVYEQAARGPERQRSFDLAERLYKQALALDECFLPAHEGLARLYVSAGPGYCSKALDRYATLLKCYPTSAQYHIGAAEALDRMGGADADAAAIHHYLTALEIDRHVEEHGAQLSADEKAKVSERIRAIESRYPPEVIENMRKATGDVTK